jgi:hypothetical protein
MVFHINPDLKWLNLFCRITVLAWISGREADWTPFPHYLTLVPNMIPRGAFLYRCPAPNAVAKA